MARYEVEVIGHFSSVVEVEADSYEEAEMVAVQDFEQDYSPYSSKNGWTDSWGHTEIEMCRNLDEEEY
jgi:hypothetical protein